MLTKQLFTLTILGSFLLAGSLSNLVNRGVRSHPQILSSSYKEQAKGFSYNQQVDRYKPQLSISAEWGQENYKYEYPQRDIWTHGRYYTYGAVFKQTLINIPLLKMIRDARLKRELSYLQTEDTKAKLVVRIAQTGVELMRVSQLIALNKKMAKLYKKDYLEQKTKFKMKLVNSADVANARSKWKRSLGELAKFKQFYKYIKNNLKFLANVKSIPNSLVKKRFNISKVKKVYKKRRLRTYLNMVSRNTNIKLAKKYCKIAHNMISAKKAERYPTLSFRAEYENGDWSARSGQKHNSTIGLEMNMPIYQGGAIGDRIKEARVLYYSAREDLRNAKLEDKISIEKSWEGIQSGLDTIEAIKSAESASNEYYKTTLTAHKNGLQSLTDAYKAKIEYYKIKSDRVNLEAQVLNNLLSLYYLTGKAKVSTISQFEKMFLKK
jgi:outer membrane protein